MFTFLLPSNSDHLMVHLGGYNELIFLFAHSPVQSVAHGKLHNCNLTNESSRDLNWMTTWMQTSYPNVSNDLKQLVVG